MSAKELIFTALAVAIGLIIGTIVLSKLPTTLGGGAKASWEESV
jgi:hypothetical protein